MKVSAEHFGPLTNTFTPVNFIRTSRVLPQLRVLRLGRFQDGNVGVFPQRGESFETMAARQEPAKVQRQFPPASPISLEP